MVYDLFRNFAPDFGYKVTVLVLLGTRFRLQSYIPCFFLALESGSLGLKGKK